MRNARVGRAGNQYRVYRCANIGGCGKSSISQNAVDRKVIAAVVFDYFRHPETVHNDDAVDSQISGLRARQAEIATGRADVMSLVTDPTVPFTAAQAKTELTKLGKQDEQIDAEINHLIANDARASMVSKARDELFSNGGGFELSRGGRRVLEELFGRFDKLPLADKRRLIEDRLTVTIKPHVGGMKPAHRVEIRLKRNGEIFEAVPGSGRPLVWSEDDHERYVDIYQRNDDDEF